MRRTALLLAAALLALPHAGAPAPAPPARRVVSLAPSLTETLFALGAGDALVGVTSFCDYPEAAKAKPKVGGMEDGGVDLERVLSLKPDLVVSIGEGQTRTVDALRRLGLRVEVVPSQTVEDVFSSLRRLGTLVGRDAAAQRLGGDLERRMAAVKNALAAAPGLRRPRVFYEVWDRPLMTATRNTLIGQLIELAGGVNVFGELSGRYIEVSSEALLERNPEVILAPDHHAKRVSLQNLAERPDLAGVEAVKRGRIVILEGDLVSRPGPRIADVLELLARSLHPELFPGRPGDRR